jgi:flagellar biosynthesis chaperone FliJ
MKTEIDRLAKQREEILRDGDNSSRGTEAQKLQKQIDALGKEIRAQEKAVNDLYAKLDNVEVELLTPEKKLQVQEELNTISTELTRGVELEPKDIIPKE